MSDTDATTEVGAQEQEQEQKLVCIRITAPKKIYDRCLLLPECPPLDDLEYYYRTLLDIQDATVTLTAIPVPADFNKTLLPDMDDVPSDFPVSDLETEQAEAERREKYATFLQQLCEMERSRAVLKNFKRPITRVPKYTTAITEEPIHLNGYAALAQAQGTTRRAWVQEILRELNTEPEENSLVVASPDDFPPYGWLLTPSATSTRYSRGSRILLDTATGMKWERLLGTDLYPDLIVTRRLTSRGWAFQHARSEALIEATVQWFLASQDAEIKMGLTPFMIGVDKELSVLFSAFKSVRVCNRLLESAGDSNPQSRVLRFLQALESRCLESAEIQEDIQPISLGAFHKFLTYLFRAAEIPRDAYLGDDNVRATVDRWVTSQFGFKVGAECVLPKWKELWDLVMRGKPSAVRLNHFLASMDVWDPVMVASFRRNIERPAVAQEWIRIFLDTQLVRETSARLRSTTLHAAIRRWCLRFLPEEMFGPQFAPVNVGPALTKKGFGVTKLRHGRYIMGYKFREGFSEADEEAGSDSEEPATQNPRREEVDGEEGEVEVEEGATGGVVKANTVVFTETTTKTADGGKVKNATAVRVSVVDEKHGTIEHFLYASTTSTTAGGKEATTIDLGRI
jgi:hypothetical protein